MYLTPQVAHAQYSSATPEGKRLGVLDAIYDRIMHQDMKDYPYFDFGKSTEDAEKTVFEWTHIRPNIETAYIEHTKTLPMLEEPEKTSEEILRFIDAG